MLKQIPKISCSLLAALNKEAPFKTVASDLEALGIDLLHIDITDNGNKTLSFEHIKELRTFTQLPFDIHISLEKPHDILADLFLSPQDLICFHVEKDLDPMIFIELKERFNCAIGVAIEVNTDLSRIAPYNHCIDYVLFMAAEPGVSGGDFSFEVVEKIKQFRLSNPKIKIHVDGGINHYSAAVLRDIGVDALISGSYLLASNNQHQQLARLFGRNLYLQVSDIMKAPEHTSVISRGSSIQEVASAIQETQLGAACVVSDRQLQGIITDGDLRRLLIRTTDISDITADEILNPSPLTVGPNCKLLELVRTLEKKEKTPYVIPVCDDKNQYLGLIWVPDIFNNLIR